MDLFMHRLLPAVRTQMGKAEQTYLAERVDLGESGSRR